MWIGIDDTDSPRGGCTTYVLTELVRAAADRGIDLIGYPRLVRLNPNVPWKTRGNAALSARFGHGDGPSFRIGEVGSRPLRAYRRGRRLTRAEADRWSEEAWKIVRALARSEDAGTDPAMVTSDRRLPAALYDAAVRELVPVAAARRAIALAGARSRHAGSARGLVGAAASLAWPARRHTFELIAYRAPDRVGTPRAVDARSVRAAASAEPSLFLCYDERTRRTMVAPHTPCPILFGLRSRSAAAALRARPRIRSEPVDRWLLFETNQGTGDHVRTRLPELPVLLASGRIEGTVVGMPQIGAGGHVRFPLRTPQGSIVTCLAFEPTKTLPEVARALDRGDRIAVWGSRGTEPAFRLEGITVRRWSRVRGPDRPPECPSCHRRSHSAGAGRGYRCRGCGRRWPPEAARRETHPVPMPLGTYHPTPSARRHLAPLGPEPERGASVRAV